jgi:hypothetical protein
LTEPWLLGAIPGHDPVISHLLRAGQHIREDIRVALSGLTAAEIWSRPCNLTSAGFHAKHLAGSTQRLSAYLSGRELSQDELAAIPLEASGDEAPAELIHQIDAAFDIYKALVTALRPEDYSSPRYVGRARIPVTAISLAIHIVEHGQRHVGQAISAAKLVRALHHA